MIFDHIRYENRIIKLFMKKNKLLSLFVLTVLFFSCGPTQKITTSWVNPDRPQKKYTTVFVAALIQNNPVKYALEADLGAAAKARGFNVVKGHETFMIKT